MPLIEPAKVQAILGPPPASITDNLRRHWENAQRGEPTALAHVAYAFDQGKEGATQDDREAVRLYKLAADQGQAHGQLNLGTMYATGRGVAKDDRQAALLYKLAADRGHAKAQCNLGSMYADGVGGLAKDASEALRLWKLAASGGSEAAQNHLKQLGETW